jgi:hypothetical protein
MDVLSSLSLPGFYIPLYISFENEGLRVIIIGTISTN